VLLLHLQVERLLHFSDLGAAADHPSARMRSKAAGDAAVRETFPDATIFKCVAVAQLCWLLQAA
jgi:uncharacterized protein YbjT (DUF2867 family)